MSKKVTIAEVAKEAGVSIATVSRVLNRRKGKIKISEETKTTVQQAAKRLGYQADPFASALRTRRSGLFGAIIRDLRDPFLTKVFINMQEVACAKGMELLLGHANYDVATAGRQASIMSSLWFDGLILLGDIPGDLDVMERLLESKKPCIAVACGPRNDLPSINLDEDKGSIQALDYLYSLGHRRIACCGDPSILGVKERLLCYQGLCEGKRINPGRGVLPGLFKQPDGSCPLCFGTDGTSPSAHRNFLRDGFDCPRRD